MHISEGVLSAPVLVGGAALTVAGLGVALKKLRNEDIPKVGFLSAGFFVAGLIHVPIGFASVHLVLNGLVGIILGWLSFPAIFVGLLLQSIMFQYGGLQLWVSILLTWPSRRWSLTPFLHVSRPRHQKAFYLQSRHLWPDLWPSF
jgi:ABC-type Co2+ transport system permease subunit